MTKYYHICFLVHSCYCTPYLEMDVIKGHPFVWHKRARQIAGTSYKLLTWKEITEEEYHLFFTPLEDLIKEEKA